MPSETPPALRAAEFFAGIGLMRMGLERAGWKVVYANDIDPEKQEMYLGHFPHTEKHFACEDIHNLQADEIPDVELATASFPCNDLSLAGGMKGLKGAQSSAFWGFIALLKKLGDRRPKLVLLENVLGFLTSHKGEDFKEALVALNDLGYSVDPFILNASYFVPQSRARLFVVGQLGGGGKATAGESVVRPASLVKFIKAKDTIKWKIRSLPEPAPCEMQLKDILEPHDSTEWWDKKRAEYFFNQLSEKHRKIAADLVTKKRYSYCTAFRRMRNEKSTAELRLDNIAGCLRTPRGGSARQILFKAGHGKYYVRLLTPRECARLMGADDYKLDNLSLNQALFGFGDAVCVPVVEWIATNYLNKVITSKPE